MSGSSRGGRSLAYHLGSPRKIPLFFFHRASQSMSKHEAEESLYYTPNALLSPCIAIGYKNKPDRALKSVNWFLGNCFEFLPFLCPIQLFIWCSGTELIWERIRNSKLLTVVTGVSQCDSWLSPSHISLTNSTAPVSRVKVNTGSSSSGPGCITPFPSWALLEAPCHSPVL